MFKVFINNIRSYDELKEFGGYKPDERLRIWGENQMLCKISTYAPRGSSNEEIKRRTWDFISTMRSNALGRWDYRTWDLDNGNETIIILPSLPYRIDEDLRNDYFIEKKKEIS